MGSKLEVGTKELTDLPDDDHYRVLAWFGNVVNDIEKNEPRIEIAFAKFNPLLKTDKLFGGPSYYQFFSYSETGKYKTTPDDFFECYFVGIELMVFLRLGSIWKGRQEIKGRVDSVKGDNINLTFPKIPAKELSNPNGKIFTFKQLFGADNNYFSIPSHQTTTCLYRVDYKQALNNDKQDKTHVLLFPLNEIVRKFYFQSSGSVYGIVNGSFTDLEKAPFEKSSLGIQIDDAGQRTAHVDFLSPALSHFEAALIAMLLYSKPALEGARLVSDTLEASIKDGLGIISSTKFPFDKGFVDINVRYKRVCLKDNTWAYLILEIISCKGEREFEKVAPHSPYQSMESPGDGPPVNFRPRIQHKSIKESDFTPIDTRLSRDSNMSRIQVTVNEDLTSGYGGISILKSKRLPKGYKSHRLDIYKNYDFRKLATGFGDRKNKTNAPGTNFGGKPSKFKEKTTITLGTIEVNSLEFFKVAINKIAEIMNSQFDNKNWSDVFDKRFISILSDEQFDQLKKNRVNVFFVVFEDLKSSVGGAVKVMGSNEFSQVIYKGEACPRRAIIIRITFSGKEFLAVEFEKYVPSEIRTILIAKDQFSPFANENDIRLIFEQLCKNKGVAKNIRANKYFHNYKIKLLNHKYELKEIHMTRKILECISDTNTFSTILVEDKDN